MKANGFDPDWCCHPCLTLLDVLEDRALTVAQLAAGLGSDESFAQRLLQMQERFTPEVAAKLETMFGASAQFWINRQENFDSHLDRLVKRHERDGRPFFVHTPAGIQENFDPRQSNSQ